MDEPRRLGSVLLGLVAVALFVGAVAVTGVFLTGGFVGGVRVDAVFSAPGVGQQLPVGGDVKVRGVLVGTIAGIRLEDGGRTAVVELALDADVELPADTGAEIRSKTMFGQKWVELRPAAATSTDVLAEGSVIPDERTREPLELERALQLGHDLISEVPLQDLATIFETLAEGFTGSEADARTAIDRGLVALRAVNSRTDELDLSLRQLREFSEWLDDNDADIVALMDGFDQANRALVGAAPEFSSSLDSVPVFLDDFSSFLESVEDDLGQLVEEGATVAELVAARSDRLTDIIVQLEPFLKVWNSGLSEPCAGQYESNMTCWKVYQLPGLESRGLYGAGGGTAPNLDEPGDPGPARSRLSTRDPSALRRLILAPLREGSR